MPRPVPSRPTAANDARLEITQAESDGLVIQLTGHWQLSRDLPDLLE